MSHLAVEYLEVIFSLLQAVMDELPPLIVPKKPVGIASPTGFVPIEVKDAEKATPQANQLSNLVNRSGKLMKV